MSTEPEAIDATRVRSLARWGIPFHYGLPIGVAVVGWLLLSAGGATAFAGGWWLVVVLPIAIGAFLGDPWFAAGPAAVWLVWLVVAAISGGDSGVAQTPVGVAITLAVIGAAATRVAQLAIFPATARAAWEPTVQRLSGSGDDDDNDDAGAVVPDDGEVRLPELDMTQMTVTMDAIVPIGTAELGQLNEAALVADVAEAKEAEKTQAALPVPASESVRAETPTPTPTPTPDTDEPIADAEEPTEVEPDRVPKVVHTELPLDVDPAPLDEGGHVTEFKAITEADILAADLEPEAGDQPGSDVP